MTDGSIYGRLASENGLEGSGYNWERWYHIIQSFGPVSITYATHENPRQVESEAIRIYSQEHLEEPPFNMNS